MSKIHQRLAILERSIPEPAPEYRAAYIIAGESRSDIDRQLASLPQDVMPGRTAIIIFERITDHERQYQNAN